MGKQKQKLFFFRGILIVISKVIEDLGELGEVND